MYYAIDLDDTILREKRVGFTTGGKTPPACLYFPCKRKFSVTADARYNDRVVGFIGDEVRCTENGGTVMGGTVLRRSAVTIIVALLVAVFIASLITLVRCRRPLIKVERCRSDNLRHCRQRQGKLSMYNKEKNEKF